MKLVITEKPSVAMALASVLGARTRKDGYVEGNGYIVSWCVGHLVGLRKRQSNCVLCTASKARTWIWKLYNYKDWRQSGVSKSVLLRYRCRRKREFFR